MIRNIFFFMKEAFIGMKQSSLMIFIAMATIFISLVCFGFFLVVNLNLLSFSEHLSKKLEVRVFLKSTLTKKEIDYFKTSLTRLTGVSDVVLVNKQKAWQEFKDQYTALNLESLLDDNPLPHSIKVFLVKDADISRVANVILGFKPYVDDVVYGSDAAENLQSISRFVFYVGAGFVGILSLATFLIVINTIRLTILNRSEEIEIMKLVGATDSFVMGPFLFEGVILGIVSSFAAILLIHLILEFLISNIAIYFPFLPFDMSIKNFIIVYSTVLVWGGCLSLIGALISTKATLKKIL